MWEAIRSNRRRSWMLILLMGVILIALGGVIGMVADPALGGFIGAAVAAAIWLVLWLVAARAGDSVLLTGVGARQVEKVDAPQLINVVEEMTIAAGLASPPRVFVIDDDAPNAFAVGRDPKTAAVAVTSGLMKRLTRDELQGVMAHEIGHIKNLDVRFMTLAAVMVGSIVLISDTFLRSLWFGGGRRRSSSARGGGYGQLIMLGIAILLAILGPICAQMLYFACSRRREFLADASAARFTRYPDGLASALLKISQHAGAAKKTNRAVAPLFIINPLQARAATSMMATHPPIEQRVQILRGMGGQAGYAAYEAAFRQIRGERDHCLGQRTLDAAENVAAREATPEPERKEQAVARAREAVDLIDRMANFLLLPCVCGVRIKLPPDFKRSALNCPRCGREHKVPKAEPAPAESGRPADTMRYQRKGGGWESFRCACGHTIQLSPSFNASDTTCRKCSRRIEISGAGSS